MRSDNVIGVLGLSQDTALCYGCFVPGDQKMPPMLLPINLYKFIDAHKGGTSEMHAVRTPSTMGGQWSDPHRG